MQRNFVDEDIRKRERLIYRYVSALDEGDINAAAVFDAAQNDSELDRLIAEINLAYQDEEALTPLAADANLMRELIRRHLPAAFETQEHLFRPLTVGEVASYLQAQRRVQPSEQDVTRSLLKSRAPLPKWLSVQEVKRLAAELGVNGSERFWKVFRDAAITLCMGHNHQQAQLAAREERGRKPTHRERNRVSTMSERIADAKTKINAAVHRAFTNAGLDYDSFASGIVPLSDIIGAHPLRISELIDGTRRLTYRTALEFLSTETGQQLRAPDDDDRPLSGFLYAYNYDDCLYGCIFTERSDQTPHCRYSAAHELGHYLLHFLPLLERQRRVGELESVVLVEGLSIVEGKESDDEIESSQLTAAIGTNASWRHAPDFDTEERKREMEREADNFAAELLMPANACREFAGHYIKKFGKNKAVVIRRLATEFLVSQAAMRRRLIELGFYAEGSHRR